MDLLGPVAGGAVRRRARGAGAPRPTRPRPPTPPAERPSPGSMSRRASRLLALSLHPHVEIPAVVDLGQAVLQHLLRVDGVLPGVLEWIPRFDERVGGGVAQPLRGAPRLPTALHHRPRRAP